MAGAWQPPETEHTATPSRIGYPQLKVKSFMINFTILYPDELTVKFRFKNIQEVKSRYKSERRHHYNT